MSYRGLDIQQKLELGLSNQFNLIQFCRINLLKHTTKDTEVCSVLFNIKLE